MLNADKKRTPLHRGRAVAIHAFTSPEVTTANHPQTAEKEKRIEKFA